MKDIDFSLISKYRSELMGFAMIYVVTFHVCGARHDTLWYCLARCGNLGVDIFLFLSGIGLWFAWTKTPSLRHFYWRRYKRIYPAWLVIASLFYIPKYIDGNISIAELIGEITFNYSFWHHLALNFWYVPAILALYLIAPWYMKLIQANAHYRWMPVAAMLLTLLVQYWSPLHHSVGHLEIFFSRIPIFLIGINVGAMVKSGYRIQGSSIWLLLIIMVMSTLVCVNFEDGLRRRFPLFIERWAYIPWTVSLTLLLSMLFERLHVKFLFLLTVTGTVSLELYLIHIEFVMKNVKPLHLGYWATFAITFGISLVMAYGLHYIIDKLLSIPFFRKIQKKK